MTTERMTPGSMTNEEIWTIVCAAAGKQAGIDTAQARTILEASGLCADWHSGIVAATNIVKREVSRHRRTAHAGPIINLREKASDHD